MEYFARNFSIEKRTLLQKIFSILKHTLVKTEMKSLVQELVPFNAVFGSEPFINSACTDLELGEQCSDDCITQMFNCINNCGTDATCQSACARDQVDCVDGRVTRN